MHTPLPTPPPPPSCSFGWGYRFTEWCPLSTVCWTPCTHWSDIPEPVCHLPTSYSPSSWPDNLPDMQVSGLTAHQATSYKLLSQLASLRPLLVHLECSPLLPELFHTRKVQFKCSFLQEVFCNCPIVTNPSSRQPWAHYSCRIVSMDQPSCIIADCGGGGLCAQGQPFESRGTQSTPFLPNSNRSSSLHTYRMEIQELGIRQVSSESGSIIFQKYDLGHIT